MNRIRTTTAHDQTTVHGHFFQCCVSGANAVSQHQITVHRHALQGCTRRTHDKITLCSLRDRLRCINIHADQVAHDLCKFRTGDAALGIQFALCTTHVSTFHQCRDCALCPVRNLISVGKSVQHRTFTVFQRKGAGKHRKCLLACNFTVGKQFAVPSLEGSHLHRFGQLGIIPRLRADILIPV